MNGLDRLTARAFTLSLLGVLAACANLDSPKDWSVEKLQSEAKDAFVTGNYERAVSLYDKLEGRAAGTLLAQQAQLEKAYAHYKAGDMAQSISTIDRFVKLHPSSAALDYALYLKGLVNFNDNKGVLGNLLNRDLAERDQRGVRESFEAFRELVTRFPSSKYTVDARPRMAYLVNSLAQHDVHIAHYYYRRGAYVAAVSRAQSAISEYREVPAIQEALYVLSKSHHALGLTQLAQDSQRILEASYPESPWLRQLKTEASAKANATSSIE
jgi:outer membrane protein assembly factor BamD